MPRTPSSFVAQSIATLLLVAGTSGSVSGQTIRWNLLENRAQPGDPSIFGPPSDVIDWFALGSWTNPDGSSANRIPDSSDDVVIGIDWDYWLDQNFNLVPGYDIFDYTIQIRDADVTMNSLVIEDAEATLRVDEATLSAGSLSNAGTIFLSPFSTFGARGGRLNIAGDIQNDGVLEMATPIGGLFAAPANSISVGGTLYNRGTLIAGTTGQNQAGANTFTGDVVNEADGIFRIGGATDFLGGLLVNRGDLTIQAPTRFLNGGGIRFDGGTIAGFNNITLANGGRLELFSGTGTGGTLTAFNTQFAIREAFIGSVDLRSAHTFVGDQHIGENFSLKLFSNSSPNQGGRASMIGAGDWINDGTVVMDGARWIFDPFGPGAPLFDLQEGTFTNNGLFVIQEDASQDVSRLRGHFINSATGELRVETDGQFHINIKGSGFDGNHGVITNQAELIVDGDGRDVHTFHHTGILNNSGFTRFQHLTYIWDGQHNGNTPQLQNGAVDIRSGAAGSINFSDNAVLGGDQTISSGLTVFATGNFGLRGLDTSMAVVNHGTIAGSNIELFGTFANHGIIGTGANGSSVTLDGELVNHGSMRINSLASGFANASASSITNLGDISLISNVDVFPLLGALLPSQTFSLVNEGHLTLEQTGTFIVNYDPGGATGSHLFAGGSLELTDLGTLSLYLGLDEDGSSVAGGINGLEIPPTFDSTTEINIGGMLDIDLLGDFIPDADDVFTLLSANQLSGTFLNAESEYFLSGVGWFDITYNPNTVILSNFRAIPAPGTATILTGLSLIATGRRR